MGNKHEKQRRPWSVLGTDQIYMISFEVHSDNPPVTQENDTPTEYPITQLPEEDDPGSSIAPTSLNSIKEYIGEKDGDTIIPLHSTISLKKPLYHCTYPLNAEKTIDLLVDSSPLNNAM